MLVPSLLSLIIGKKTYFILKRATEDCTWNLFKECSSIFYKHIYSIGHHFVGKYALSVDAYGNSLYNNSIDYTHIMVILEWKHINHNLYI